MNLILGGTHGLGQKIAAELQRQGKDTFVVGRTYDQGKHGSGMKADLSKPEDIEAVVQKIGQADIEGFYWVAGYGYVGDFAEQPEPQKMAEVNFSNIMPIAQTIWQKMLKAGGNYVVISSVTGQKARKNEAVYAGTKHAQVGFARSLGQESERLKSDVKVALFMPGGMQTPFWKAGEPASFKDFLNPEKVAERVVQRITGQQDYFYEETIERGSL
jgi:3-oxoacyl-[acyl-carrier protein] reductase